MSDKAEGLWRAEDLLVVSRKHSRFPKRCIWTNSPIEASPTKLKLQFIPYLGWRIRCWRGIYLARTTPASCELTVPISEGWKGARNATLDAIGRGILATGLALFLPAVVLIIYLSIDPPQGGDPIAATMAIAAGICGGIAVPATIVGLAWRYVELPCSPEQPVLAKLINDDYVFLGGVDPGFLGQLPVWTGPALASLLPPSRSLLTAIRHDFIHLVFLILLIFLVVLSKRLIMAVVLQPQ